MWLERPFFFGAAAHKDEELRSAMRASEPPGFGTSLQQAPPKPRRLQMQRLGEGLEKAVCSSDSRRPLSL